MTCRQVGFTSNPRLNTIKLMLGGWTVGKEGSVKTFIFVG